MAWPEAFRSAASAPVRRWRQAPNLMIPIWLVLLALVHGTGAALDGFVTGFSPRDDPRAILAVAGLLLAGGFLAVFGPIGRFRLQHDVFDYVLVFLGVVLLHALTLRFDATAQARWPDAVVESMALFSTTNSETSVGKDQLPLGVLANEALLQLMGAVWFVQFTLVAIPAHILHSVARSDGLDMRSTPAFRRQFDRLWLRIWIVMAVLTAAGAAGFWGLGARAFDAFLFAAALVSLGGQVPFDGGLGSYSAGAHLWAILLMIAGATNWLLHVRAGLRLSLRPYAGNWEFRSFLAILAGGILIVLAVRLSWADIAMEQALRELVSSALLVVSLVTTTGMSAVDYQAWPGLVGLILVLSIIGGCAGSPSGGIKVARIVFQFKVLSLVVRGRRQTRVGQNGMSLAALQFMQIYMTLFLVTIFLSTAVLSFTGLDFVTSFSVTVSNLTNLGVGVGDQVGPSGSYAGLNDAAKCWIAILMMLGRFELGLVFLFVGTGYWSATQMYRTET